MNYTWLMSTSSGLSTELCVTPYILQPTSSSRAVYFRWDRKDLIRDPLAYQPITHVLCIASTELSIFLLKHQFHVMTRQNCIWSDSHVLHTDIPCCTVPSSNCERRCIYGCALPIATMPSLVRAYWTEGVWILERVLNWSDAIWERSVGATGSL